MNKENKNISLKKNPVYLLRFLTIVVIVKLFLPVAHIYLLDFSITLLFSLAVGTIIIFCPGYFKRIKSWMLMAFFLMLILFLFIIEGHYPLDYRRLIYFAGIIFFAFILDVFKYLEDYKGLALISFVALIVFLITAITTINGLNQFPYASRLLAGGLTASMGEEQALLWINLYKRIGIGGYDYITGIAILFPVIVCFFKKKWKDKKINIFYGILTIVLYYTVLKSNYATALIITTFSGLVALFYNKHVNLFSIVSMVMVIIGLFISTSVFSDLTVFIANLFDSGTILNVRTLEIHDVLFENTLRGNLGSRVDLYGISLSSFLSNPLIGVGKTANLGGHAMWLDLLGTYGILIVIPMFILFFNRFRESAKNLPNNERFIFLICFINFLILGWVKGMASISFICIMFFIIPGCFYQEHLFKVKQDEPNLFSRGLVGGRGHRC